MVEAARADGLKGYSTFEVLPSVHAPDDVDTAACLSFFEDHDLQRAVAKWPA